MPLVPVASSYKNPVHPPNLVHPTTSLTLHQPASQPVVRHRISQPLSPPQTSTLLQTKRKNAPQGRRQEARLQGPFHCLQGSREEGCRQEDRCFWRQEEAHQVSQGDLLFLHLQGPQAGPPRHRYFQPRHVYPELLRQRHLRARRLRGLQAGRLQQEVHYLVPRDPDLCSSHPAR